MFQLLQDYQGQDVDGWFMSPKKDGWRILWDGSNYVLRGGGVLNVPPIWKFRMPDCVLDGELDPNLGNFNSIHGMMRDDFRGLTFQVFDAPSALPFRKRLAHLKTLALPDHCRLVEQIRCRDTQHLIEFADAIVDAGGEGAVVRDPRALYQAGRCDSILRWVPVDPRQNRRKSA